ncbi:Hypothetical_protein [Hexamita inflata]|uniref:Hypothetical_protein n=1 Tax=Hexamita inflata TaxID=28002 RepID=A0AA86V196_9EUKA|nr:Hypothetical protein HINF_LOCUS64289 [Hexamita inflata]
MFGYYEASHRKTSNTIPQTLDDYKARIGYDTPQALFAQQQINERFDNNMDFASKHLMDMYSGLVPNSTKNREIFESMVATSGQINKLLGLQLRQDVLRNHCKGVYLKEIDKRKYQYETTQEYWQCVVLIDPRASSVKDFVDICDVIPLSEADVERLFSMVGLITTKRRVMIGNTLLNSLITVKKDTLQMYAE